MKKLLLLCVLTSAMQVHAQFWQGFMNGMNQATQQMLRQQQIQRQREAQQERLRQQQEAARRQQEEAQRQAEAAKVTKEYKSEEDGFAWYETKQYGKYGAETTDGKTIISPRYSSVYYYNSDKNKNGEGCFCVTEFDSNGNSSEGVYETDGTYVIPTSRGYSSAYKRIVDDGYYYSVEKNGKCGACDASGREIITPQYESVFYNNIDHVLKCENSSGEYVNTGITLQGSSSGSSSTLNSSDNSIDFVFDLYVKKACNEDINPIPKMPKNEDGTFNEYLVRIELNSSSINYKIMTVDRLNNDKTELIESHSITPSSSVLTSTSDGKIQFCEYENGKLRGLQIDKGGIVNVGIWNNKVFDEGWCFLPFSLYKGIGEALEELESAVAMYEGFVRGFNENTNFEHTQAGETDFSGKYIKLKTALQKYSWKKNL